MKKALFLAMLLALWGAGCVTYQTNISLRDVALLYNPSATSLHPEHLLYHTSDSSGLLLTRVFTKELLFNQANATGGLQARMRVRYRLYNSFQSSTVVDSASVVYVMDRANISDEFVSYLPIEGMGASQRYVLEVFTTDVYREKSSVQYIIVDNTSSLTAQNYLLTTHPDKYPAFRGYKNLGEAFSVRYSRRGTGDLFVTRFEPDSTLPAPPFSTTARDSVVLQRTTVLRQRYDESTPQRFERTGVYLFQVDTLAPGGMLVNCFHDDFPYLRMPAQLLEPLAYLTTTEELARLLAHPSQKIALDNFWLDAAGSMVKAKELIRVYYNRVLLANVYFTSHKEGWRTDRGMLYVMFGPPSRVFKTNLGETWQYGKTPSPENTFVFNRYPTRFADENYVLVRKAGYRNLWYRAYDTWRAGKVFFFEN